MTSGAEVRRVLLGRLALRAAIAVVLFASVWLFLLYLARCDREGRRTLFQLNALMAALLSAGSFLYRAAETHAMSIRAATLLLFAVGIIGVLLGRRENLRRFLPAALGLSLLLLSAALFLPPPSLALGFFAGLAAGVAFLFLDEPPNEGSPLDRAKVLLLIPFGIAVALRFFALAEVPRGFSEHCVVHHNDLTLRYLEDLFRMLKAGQLGAAARWVGHNLVGEHLGFTCLLGALGFKLIGVSFVAARLISAAVGSLTVLAAYFLGAQLLDRRLGLLFSCLLAISPWHVTVSRYCDLEHVPSPLQLLLTLGFYVAAVRNGRLRDYILTAVLLGFSWFVYATNLLVPVVLGVHLVSLLALRRGFPRRDGWKICVFALLFGLISYVPLSKMIQEGLLTPGARTGYQGSGKIPLASMDRNWNMLVAEGKQLFVQVGDPWFRKPGGGLSLTEAAFFVPGVLLGAGGLFVPSRRLSSSLILIALPFSFLPAILAPDVSFRRLYLAATLALLLASLVLSRSLDALRELGFPRRFRLLIVVFLGAALTAVNAHVYFDRVRAEAEDGAIYLTELSKCAAASLGKDFTYLYLAPGTQPHDYYRYIRLVAYEQLKEFEKAGVKQEDLYEIVFGRDILRVLDAPRRIEGRFRILAEESLVSRSAKKFDLRSAILQAYPQAEEERLGPAGQQFLLSWQVR